MGASYKRLNDFHNKELNDTFLKLGIRWQKSSPDSTHRMMRKTGFLCDQVLSIKKELVIILENSVKTTLTTINTAEAFAYTMMVTS